MNYFREAEKVLSSRKDLDRALLNLYRKEKRLIDSGAPQELTGLDPAKPCVSEGMVSNTMTDFLDLMEVRKEITITEAKIKEIDDVIKQLSEDQQTILNLWYIEGKGKDEMCDILNYATRKSLYDHRNPAIAKFAILYFGAPALDAI